MISLTVLALGPSRLDLVPQGCAGDSGVVASADVALTVQRSVTATRHLAREKPPVWGGFE